MAAVPSDEQRAVAALARLDLRRNALPNGADHPSDNYTNRKWHVTAYMDGAGEAELKAFADGGSDSDVYALFPRILGDFKNDRGQMVPIKIACQLERCPTTHRLHLQGFVSLPQSWGARAVLDLFCNAAGEKRRGWATRKTWGNDEWCVNYCTDDLKRVAGTRAIVRGVFETVAAVAKPLQKAIAAIAEGSNPRAPQFAREHPQAVVLWHRGLDVLHGALSQGRGPNFKPYVCYLAGDSGSGKSALARELCLLYHNWQGDEPSPDIKIANCEVLSSGFVNGYNGETFVIFDDICPSDWIKQWSVICKLLDRYTYSFNVKGSERRFDAKCIIITCKQMPSDAFRGTGYDERRSEYEFLRRLSEIRYCRKGVDGLLLPWILNPTSCAGISAADIDPSMFLDEPELPHCHPITGCVGDDAGSSGDE